MNDRSLFVRRGLIEMLILRLQINESEKDFFIISHTNDEEFRKKSLMVCLLFMHLGTDSILYSEFFPLFYQKFNEYLTEPYILAMKHVIEVRWSLVVAAENPPKIDFLISDSRFQRIGNCSAKRFDQIHIVGGVPIGCENTDQHKDPEIPDEHPDWNLFSNGISQSFDTVCRIPGNIPDQRKSSRELGCPPATAILQYLLQANDFRGSDNDSIFYSLFQLPSKTSRSFSIRLRNKLIRLFPRAGPLSIHKCLHRWYLWGLSINLYRHRWPRSTYLGCIL